MKHYRVFKKFNLLRQVSLFAVLLMISTPASADIVVGYIPTQSVDITSTAWFAWFQDNVEPIHPGSIQYHGVDNVELLNELMNTFTMVDFAVLRHSQIKEFRLLSGVLSSVNIGTDSILIVRNGINEIILNEFEEILIGSIQDDTDKILPPKTSKSQVSNNSHDITNFVTSAYRRFLHREPDRGGLNYWVGMIERGQITREQAAERIANSKEAKELKSSL